MKEMCDLAQIQQILQEKQQLLLLFEEETQQMLTCPSALLAEKMEERQRLIGLIDGLDQRLETLTGQSGEEKAIRQAISGQCSCADLPQSMETLYNESVKNRTVLSRLRESDLQAALRLRAEQEMVLEQIKSANQRSGAKAARFYAASGSVKSKGSRLGNA